ncbi:MAG TPA: multidrug ABC transporter permease, partial [Rhodospirillaceae bacterium]|nr:multidrug ABC transporter permease [Rhodospirillaceae bacterium]
TVSGVIRGLIVGVVSVEALVLVAGLTVPHIGIAILFAVLGSLMLSLLGLITGILGDKFDHLGAMQNFIIMPATFLSGTFFSVSQLPEEWRFICFLNPFFYMIDGFRYAFTGQADALPVAGAGMLFIVSAVLFTIAYWLFAKGTRLKA